MSLANFALKSPLFRGNSTGDVINWETAPLTLDGMNIIKKDRDSLCSQDESFYAVLPFSESMISMKKVTEKSMSIRNLSYALTTPLKCHGELVLPRKWNII